MFDIGFHEIIIVLVIAVIVIGPTNLPKLVQTVDHSWDELQKTFSVKNRYSSMREFRYFQFITILSFVAIVIGPLFVAKLMEAIQILLTGL